jgi:hypothetical protein
MGSRKTLINDNKWNFRPVNAPLLFFQRKMPDAAEGLFGDAKIGSNNMLRKTLQKFGIAACQLGIALFRRQTNGRSKHHKTLAVYGPPVFNAQTDNMFGAFVVNTVLPHSPFNDKCGVLADLAFPQEILSFPYFLGCITVPDQLCLAAGERCGKVTVYVVDKGFVHYSNKGIEISNFDNSTY